MRWKTSVAFWKIVPWGELTSELKVSSVPPPSGHYFHLHSRRISKFGFSFILSTGSPWFNSDFYSGFQNKFSNVISLWFSFPYDKTLFAIWSTNPSINIFLFWQGVRPNQLSRLEDHRGQIHPSERECSGRSHLQ